MWSSSFKGVLAGYVTLTPEDFAKSLSFLKRPSERTRHKAA